MMTNKPLYFDYNATAPIRPEVIALMQEAMGAPGNASAVHGFGRAARSYVEKAREQVAALCGIAPSQIIFNSGATEGNNTVLRAFAGERILVSAVEHLSVIEPVTGVELIPVDKNGIVDEAAFAAMLNEGPAPALISVMMVNNETGAIQPVEKLARMAKKIHPSVHFHTDAVQAAGKMKIDVPALQVDYMTLSAHKIGGPQGCGALIAASGARTAKLLHGSGQEQRRRAGTENVAGIAGFGLAAGMAAREIEKYGTLAALREKLETGMRKEAPGMIVYAHKVARVPNVTAFSLPGVPAQTLLMGLDLEGIAISRGTACGSGAVRPSHVIQAMAGNDAPPDGALRISMGWNTQPAEIDAFLAAWSKIAGRLQDGGEMKRNEAAHA